MLCGRCAWQERGPTEWERGRGCFIAGGRAVASLVSSTVDGIDSDVAASTTEGDAEEYAMPMRLWDDHFPLAAFAAVSWDATRTTEEAWLFMSWNGHKQTRILYKAVRIRKMTVFI
jgi:hypothetical protein